MLREVYKPLNLAGWRGQVRPDWIDRLDEDPLAILQANPHRVVHVRPTATTTLVRLDGEHLFFKHITGRKDLSHGLRRRWHEWLHRLTPARALHTLKISVACRQAGMHVPQVLFAGRRQHQGTAEDLLITRPAPGCNPHLLFHHAVDRAACLALADHLGAAVAAFHRAGFIHGDLLPGNIVVTDADSPVYFIDNERTHRGRGRLARRRNLMQMCYRLTAHRSVGFAIAKRVLTRYARDMHLSEPAARRLRRAVWRRVRRRAAETHGDRTRQWRITDQLFSEMQPVSYDLD